jgi:hypothetical protein
MALSLMDFTSGNVDLGVTLPGGSSSSAYKCVLGDLSFRLSRSFQDRKTLCSGPWNQRAPQNKVATITATKYASTGNVISDPMVLQSSDDPCAVTFTANTLNTITGNFHCGDEGLGGVAGSSLFGGPLQFENYGAVSSTWVTT